MYTQFSMRLFYLIEVDVVNPGHVFFPAVAHVDHEIHLVVAAHIGGSAFGSLLLVQLAEDGVHLLGEGFHGSLDLVGGNDVLNGDIVRCNIRTSNIYRMVVLSNG